VGHVLRDAAGHDPCSRDKKAARSRARANASNASNAPFRSCSSSSQPRRNLDHQPLADHRAGRPPGRVGVRDLHDGQTISPELLGDASGRAPCSSTRRSRKPPSSTGARREVAPSVSGEPSWAVEQPKPKNLSTRCHRHSKGSKKSACGQDLEFAPFSFRRSLILLAVGPAASVEATKVFGSPPAERRPGQCQPGRRRRWFKARRRGPGC
jgi:hypothetical protein